MHRVFLRRIPSVRTASSLIPSFSHKVPPGDDKLRPVCENCGFINYKNPKIVVGCVVADGMGHILLGKRGIQPRHGYWGLPGGFMESHESLEDGAAREAREELCADVAPHALLAVFSVPSIDQVHVYYAAKFKNPLDPKFAAGSETLEGALFHPDEIPWANMAFPTGKAALKHYLKCIKEGGIITPLQRVFREPEPK